MTVDLSTLISDISDCKTLGDSLSILIEGLARQVENGADPKELAAAMRFVSKDISLSPLIIAVVTKNTSHIAVDYGDPLIPVVCAVFDCPRADRKKHIALINFAIETAGVDLADHLVELQDTIKETCSQLESVTAEVANKDKQLAAIYISLEESEAALKIASSELAIKTTLLDEATKALDVKNATLVTKDAQLELAEAKLAVVSKAETL